MWDVRENALKVVTGPAHKRVTEATEISAVPHLLGEDVGDVAFPADVRNGDGAVGDPFACRIFFVLDVTIAFGGHIVTPLDAGVVVVVERCRKFAVRDGVTEVGEARNHVSCVHCEAGAHVGCPNLGFARAEGCAFLTVGFPCNGAA